MHSIAPIPPGHVQAFATLGKLLNEATPPAIVWGPWAAEPRAKGYQVTRESRCGVHREWLLNCVGKTKLFRVLERAEEAAGGMNAGGGA